MTTTHHLKTHPAPFADVEAGRKTFEIRSTQDRTFAVGDVLVLEEWDPDKAQALYLEYGRRHSPTSDDDLYKALSEAQRDATRDAYTGRSVTRTVTYIFDPQGERYGLQPGYVVLGLSVGGQPL